MKRIKIAIALLVTFVLICALIPKSFAAGSFSASLTPSSSRVKKGDEVTVTLKLTGINVDGGIAALRGTLRFDTDVLSLSADDIKTEDDWTKTYDENSKKLVFDRSSATKSDSTVATMKFKVSDSTSSTTAAIQFASIFAGNADLEDEVKISDITTNITIGTSILSSPTTSPSSSPSESPSTSPSTVPTTEPGNQVVQTSTPTSQSGGNNKNTQSGDENIPKTGADNYVLPLMFIIAILGTISFVGYKNIGKA